MTKILPSAMAGALLLALTNAQPLLAADFGAPGLPAPVDSQRWAGGGATPFDWSGSYVGIHGGLIADGRIPTPFSADGRTLTGGVHAGTRYQHGLVVLGAEVAADYANKLNHDVGAGQLQQKWSGSVQATAGVALDRFLVMGSAGYGRAQLKGVNGTSTDQKAAGGLVFGSTVEYAFDDSLSLRLGYEQARLNKVKATFGGVTETNNLVNHTIKTGINIRF